MERTPNKSQHTKLTLKRNSLAVPAGRSKERQPQAVSEVSYHQPNLPSQQDHAPSYPQPTQGQGWRTAGRKKQAGVRPGQSTVEQTLNSRVIIEKHLQHQRDLFHNFIDFKKAFDRVWHAGLWQVLRSFNIEEGLVQTIRHYMRTPAMQSS